MVDKRNLVFVVEIDEAELALRFVRILTGMKPKPGTDARVAMEQAEATWRPEAGPFPFREMSRAAVEYFRKCIDAGREPS